MPNHVHAIFQPIGGHTPSSILHSWKSFTSHQINKLLERKGVLWEQESFDHLVRRIEHLEWFIRYVEDNPVRAGFCANPEDWPWSSAATKSCSAGVPPACP
ncbi:MAG: transposase [Planctomycetia bacterium]